ncbi:hypothetical protein CANCADRAFT_43119 [Tortispora caseinolytica NRRL Y-17796]|uniref:Sugar phosphate transporter domain-containing protein n=1 Tax=Tortispora caseinolytica NRRL Y-17796 TaxID=767744 RepID=A0A1E4TL66_9ASCO|nr:hypothetical protein CANCADRAFT_43119 [Tortispora caseinolytica NRRL Y-17796]
MGSERPADVESQSAIASTAPPPAPPKPPTNSLTAAAYVSTWIALSSSVILYNKYVLHTLHFSFPVFLTAWHMVFSTIITQIMAHFTHILDDRHRIKMNPSMYIKLIVPIGICFNFSLIFNNQAYLYLSVAFIQMLKATTPVAVLLVSYATRVEAFNLRTLLNVSIIVIGVMIASYGEIAFSLVGFLFQISGIAFEATRLVMVGQLLNGPNLKMNPLVSLYYFAPICGFFLIIIFFFTEFSRFGMANIQQIGPFVLLSNAAVAFCLNVAVVMLVGKTSSLVLTLCGILKDILLVFASMVIWHTIVTPLQFFGYSIALVGLLYYKLGYKQMVELFENITRGAQDYLPRRPARRFLLAVVVCFLIGTLLAWYSDTLAMVDPKSLQKLTGITTPANKGSNSYWPF